jgi:replicative DNA helicase
MTSFSDQFNRHFQDNFVAHMLRDSNFLGSVAEDLTPELFPDETVNRLVRIILDFHRREGTCPETLIFQVLDRDLADNVLTDEQHKTVSMLADELFAAQLQNRTYLLEQFSNFCRIQKYRTELPKIHDILAKGNINDADAVLSEILDYRAGQDMKFGRFYSPEDMLERTARRRKEDDRRLITFIPELDAIVPGIGTGNLNLVQSRQSSDGKTAFLTLLARSFAFQGANTIIFTVGDMTEDEYEDRLDMCFAGLTREELTYDSTVIEAQRRLSKFRAKVHIKEFPARRTTVTDLRAYVDRLASTYSYYPDVVIIDYAACLGSSTGQYRLSRWEESADVYESIKEWMQADRLRCWTAGQSNRDAAKEAYGEQSHVAGSMEIVRIADLIVSVARESQDKTGIKITKTRHSGARGQTFEIPTNFDRMQFYYSGDTWRDEK